MTIPKKSSWPFHPLLVQMAKVIDAAPAEQKQEAVLKTVERCIRLAMKLAVHYGVPAPVVRDITVAMMKKEGGKEYPEQLKTAAKSSEVPTVPAAPDATSDSDAETIKMLKKAAEDLGVEVVDAESVVLSMLFPKPKASA
jgi:predicted nucleic acid-binding protein